jgi:tellurite resistance protein TerC
MGLRQLYFLLGGLINKLTYLNVGLAGILGFIGVKLILTAMHRNTLPFINGGQPIEWAPEFPIPVSLSVIAGCLVLAVIASLIKARVDKSRADREPPVVLPQEEAQA